MPYFSRQANLGSEFLKYHVIDDKKTTVKILSDRPCRAGKQLYEDYGDNRNLVYLMNHGFVPSENPFNAVPIDLFTAGADTDATRRAFAKTMSVDEDLEIMADPNSRIAGKKAVLERAVRVRAGGARRGSSR